MNPEFGLRPYQAQHCAFHITHRASLNYSACATGKTYTMAWLAEYYWKTEQCKTVLINPISLSVKNKDEIVRFTDFAEDEVQIVSGTPAKRVVQWKNTKAKVFIVGPDLFGKEWEQMLPDVKSILVDESHLAYSGHKSARTQAFYMAQKKANHITFFTATPLSSGAASCAYPLFAVCAPRIYTNNQRFMNYHCIKSNLGFIVGWKNLDVLGRNLKTFSVGISFAEAYKNSPGNIISFEKCGFDDDELQRIYSEMEEEGLAELEDHYVETPNGAVALMKCRQLLSCPEAVGYNPKKLAKMELLRTHLQRIVDGAEKQILVFSCFVAAQERVVALCKEMGLSVGLINGSVVGAARAQISDDFAKGRIQVLVASPLTMSVGHNFQNIDELVFVDCDWSLSSFEQACFRGNRGGRSTPLPITILVVDCKVEKRYWKKLLGEKSQYKQIVDSQLKE